MPPSPDRPAPNPPPSPGGGFGSTIRDPYAIMVKGGERGGSSVGWDPGGTHIPPQLATLALGIHDRGPKWRITSLGWLVR
jgi:hypothetical protein